MQVMLLWRGLQCLVLLHLATCVVVAALQPQLELPGEEEEESNSNERGNNDGSIFKRAPLRFGKRPATGLLNDDPPPRRLRASPMRFGKRYFWDSEFFTKKSPMRFGKRAPLRFGKRSEEAEEELEKRASPMRFGKRDDEEADPAVVEEVVDPAVVAALVQAEEEAIDELEKSAPMRFGKRAPLRFGKRAPLRYGKRAPLRFGKRAPLRFGKRWPQYELEDLHQVRADF